jgi:hypothetical protein
MLIKFICWLSQHGESLQPGLSVTEAWWLRASLIAFAPLYPKAVVDVDRSSAHTMPASRGSLISQPGWRFTSRRKLATYLQPERPNHCSLAAACWPPRCIQQTVLQLCFLWCSNCIALMNKKRSSQGIDDSRGNFLDCNPTL